MKKLDIHKDTQEPSMEDMQKHMNFEDVLNRATAPSATGAKGGFSTGWFIGGFVVTTAIVATILFATQSSSESVYENISMESKPIEKLAPVVIPESLDIASNEVIETTLEKDSEQEDETSYDDYYPPITPIESNVEFYEPKLVSSIPFVFDESFQLKEQWQAMDELSIYDNLSFQPIDKAQQSMLKLTWDSVDFQKDENGQYFFILYKAGQGVICPVTPVFEKENYLKALQVYKENQ